jgi:DNA polymerase
MSAILGINDPVTKIRGQFMDFAPDFLSKKIKSFTIFHPSYLMRQPMKKKVAWLDMLVLKKFLNL